MNLRKFSISRLLKFTAFVVVISLVVFTAIFFIQQQNAQHDREALLNLEHLHQNNINLQKTRDDFLFRDIQSSELYRYGYSKATTQHDSLVKRTYEELKELENRFGNNQTVNIKTLISKYDLQFRDLKELVIQRGFKDFGLEGELRSKIHQVEENVNQQKDYRLMSHMLMLRRHEKDYIIRRDSSYIVKFEKEHAAAQAYVAERYGSKGSETAKLLNDYSKLFHAYTEIDRQIGLNENKGAQAKLKELSLELGSKINDFRKELTEKLKANSHRI